MGGGPTVTRDDHATQILQHLSTRHWDTESAMQRRGARPERGSAARAADQLTLRLRVEKLPNALFQAVTTGRGLWNFLRSKLEAPLL